MTDAAEFAGWLRQSLDERGISQRQLAHRSGLHHSTISRLLKGGRNPSHRTATRLTEALEGSRPHAKALSALLRRDPYLTDQDVARIVALYTYIRAARAGGADRLDPSVPDRTDTTRPLISLGQSGQRRVR